MTGPERVVLSWSSGKDSAWALHALRSDPAVEVVGLFTTLTRAHERVVMHAVREVLLEAQAEAAGLPLRKVYLPSPCGNEEYERLMTGAVETARDDGVDTFAFGDLYLEDVRSYREKNFERTGMTPLFPLWGRPTTTLATEMVRSGLRAYVTCVDPRALDPSFAGRPFDDAFLADLPEGVDPCGENGEFHTFVFDGPMFERPVPVRAGEVVERDGFVFADLLPV